MSNIGLRLWLMLDERSESRSAQIFGWLIITLIFVSIIVAGLDTVSSIHDSVGALLFAIEAAAIGVFTAEYVARIWLCVHGPAKDRPIIGRIRYALRALMIIDLIAIAPFYLPFLSLGGTYLRVLRLARLARILKAARYVRSIQRIAWTFQARAPELIVTLCVLLALITISAFVLYDLENTAQPDKFSSVPATLWWAVATLTTVGYGDMYPITPLGRFFASIVAILGIGMVALPAGILAEGILESFRNSRTTPQSLCPHCGKPVEYCDGGSAS